MKKPWRYDLEVDDSFIFFPFKSFYKFLQAYFLHKVALDCTKIFEMNKFKILSKKKVIVHLFFHFNVFEHYTSLSKITSTFYSTYNLLFQQCKYTFL